MALVDSPKCPRCSLAPVCLADEPNWLREQIGAGESAPAAPEMEAPEALYKPAPSPPRPLSNSKGEPAISKGTLKRGKNGQSAPSSGELRRLIAPRDERRAVYFNTPGIHVGLRQGVLVAKDKDKVVQEIRVQDMKRPALALDLMEEFRALVADSAVLTAINNGSVTTRDFVRAGDAVNLSAAGRKAFFEVYEKRVTGTIRHPVFENEVSYRRAFELQYRLLARALSGELAHYVPFKTR